MEGSVVLGVRQERRSRPRVEWMEQYNGVWIHDVAGHHVMVKEGKFDHRYYKFIDNHFRGSAATLDVAQAQLDREATEGITAWKP